MKDDNDWPDANRFQRAAYRFLTRTVNSPGFIKWAAQNTRKKQRERREQRVRDRMGFTLPVLGGMMTIAALFDFHRSLLERTIFALGGLAIFLARSEVLAGRLILIMQT